MPYHHEKQAIGFLIGYYRQKNHISRKDLLEQAQNTCFSCSPKTLVRIEKGIVSKNEIFYCSLCYQLHMTYVLNDKLLSELCHYGKRLLKILPFGSNYHLELLLKTVNEKIDHYDHVIYIYERLLLYKAVLELSLYEKLPAKEVLDIFYFLNHLLCKEDKELIFFLFMYPAIRKKAFKDIYEQWSIYQHKPLFFGYYLESIISSHSLLDAYCLLQDIQLHHSLTILENILLLSAMALLEEKGNDAVSAYGTMKNCLNYLYHDLYDSLKAHVFIQSAVLAYDLNLYEECIQYFLSVISLNMIFIKESSLLFFHVLERTHRQDLLKKYLFKTDFSQFEDESTKKIFAYYSMKYKEKASYVQREQMICNDLKHLSQQLLYKDILLEELLDIISVTGHYKCLYRFMI
ncbi:hypothetical protein [Traorella massiliensis]|uniref:hypothetical protein n=1 Tax=Traorella massiliensis TaxID=1903263 RepID=UPI0023541345|nr:hypothetical protein [Traorella massiliensis]